MYRCNKIGTSEEKEAGKDSDAKVGSEWLLWLEMSLKGTIHPVPSISETLNPVQVQQSDSTFPGGL